jgi:hypothetical protein
MFCSPMKHWMKLSLYFYSRMHENVEFPVSPSKATTLGFEARAFSRPSPYALRVEIFELDS